jgi:hypothetical protein
VYCLYRGKSLIPCILAHSINNALSTFANEVNITDIKRIFVLSSLCILSVAMPVNYENIPIKMIMVCCDIA